MFKRETQWNCYEYSWSGKLCPAFQQNVLDLVLIRKSFNRMSRIPHLVSVLDTSFRHWPNATQTETPKSHIWSSPKKLVRISLRPHSDAFVFPCFLHKTKCNFIYITIWWIVACSSLELDSREIIYENLDLILVGIWYKIARNLNIKYKEEKGDKPKHHT